MTGKQQMPSIPSESIVYPITLSMRSYLSSHHLWAAEHFTEMAGEIEKLHSGKDSFNIKHRAYVMNAILSSVAFLETTVNEVFQDAVDAHLPYMTNLAPNVRTLFAAFWEVTEQERDYHLSILDKYQTALKLAGKQPFEKDSNPYQNASLVIQLRNELAHYKPSTQVLDGSDTHKLNKKLRGKFPLNPLMKNSRNAFFPDKCLGNGCAIWTVKSCQEFADAFCLKLGVTPNYKSANFP